MALYRDTPLPLYFQLMLELREKVLKKLEPGAVIPSERELCERFRVSRITVRKATEELTAGGEIYKIHGKGTFKTRNPESSVRTLTYVIYDIAMAAYPGRERAIRAMTEVAERRGYHFVVRGFNAASGNAGFRDFAFRENNGGCIISVQELTPEDIAEIRRRRIPCVFMNQSEGYCVCAPFSAAGRLAAEWLKRRRVRSAALFVPSPDLPDNRAYLESFRKAFDSEASLAIRELPYQREAASAALESFLAAGRLPEALVCADDLLAAGCSDVLARCGLRGKVSLCGLGNTCLAGELGFSSIDLHSEECARAAAELLADVLEGKAPPAPHSIVIQPELRERTLQ